MLGVSIPVKGNFGSAKVIVEAFESMPAAGKTRLRHLFKFPGCRNDRRAPFPQPLVPGIAPSTRAQPLDRSVGSPCRGVESVRIEHSQAPTNSAIRRLRREPALQVAMHPVPIFPTFPIQ